MKVDTTAKDPGQKPTAIVVKWDELLPGIRSVFHRGYDKERDLEGSAAASPYLSARRSESITLSSLVNVAPSPVYLGVWLAASLASVILLANLSTTSAIENGAQTQSPFKEELSPNIIPGIPTTSIPHGKPGPLDPASDETTLHPSSSSPAVALSLFLIISFGLLGGRVAERLRHAPMLGMLVAGVLARNLLPSIIIPIPHRLTTKLWTIALSAVVSRAGLSLKIPVIKPNLVPTILLGSVPVIFEGLFLAHLVQLVFSLPPNWSYVLSFGVSSISPGVVVPLLLNLLEQPGWYGSRLPPLLLASTGLDVLVATTCFGVSVAAIFGHKHEIRSATDSQASEPFHASLLFRASEEILLGIGCGIIFGSSAVLLSYLKLRERNATTVLFCATTCCMIYLKVNGFPGAASASVILAWAFVANGWDADAAEAANKRLKFVWKFAEPFLFSLIGASVCLLEMQASLVISALLCVALSIAVRMCCAYFTAWLAGLSPEEQVFTSGLLTGKASVQAALSTVTMELVHLHGLDGTLDSARSRVVFACMVSAILLGAPSATSWASAFGSQVPSITPATSLVEPPECESKPDEDVQKGSEGVISL
ncbi:Sodium/hydrogen exchanger 9B2 [Phlyctochytrium bullatum]|nr:Sodium/hydrogen exchanger 9B2 [Phlyctochytrium bullatum]